MNKLLYITSSGIGENIWGCPTIKFLSYKYELKILCDSNKKNFNFLNRIFDKDYFIFCDKLDSTLTSCFFQKEKDIKNQILEIADFINDLNFDLFIYNRWQFNKNFKDSIPINLENIIKHDSKEYSMWDPRHETLFKLSGGNLSDFNLFYEQIRLKTYSKNNNIVIYQGSIWGGELRNISKDFILELCNELLPIFKNYNIYVICNENLNITNKEINCIDSKNHEDVFNLMQQGVELFIGPDSGLRWVSQIFGFKNILISEHEKFTTKHLTFNSLLDISERVDKNISTIAELSKKMLNHGNF